MMNHDGLRGFCSLPFDLPPLLAIGQGKSGSDRRSGEITCGNLGALRSEGDGERVILSGLPLHPHYHLNILPNIPDLNH